jgi:DNA-binding CsgD family transcriptional regulator
VLAFHPKKNIQLKVVNSDMGDNNSNYKLYFKIIEKYGPQSFAGIDPNDPLIIEAEEMMRKNDQFIYFGDLILFQILYTSKRCMDMMGVEPAKLSASSFFEAGHPDEMNRHLLGRTVLLKQTYDLFRAGSGYKIFSANFRMKNAEGKYDNSLMQFYIYYSTIPYKSVFVLKVHTNINWFKKRKHGYHYYLGDDLSNFRFPDNELLMKGNVFSRREFDILQLIEKGHSSEEVAEKLFLSTNTVNTHRRNILRKSETVQMSELIHNLKEQGIL